MRDTAYAFAQAVERRIEALSTEDFFLRPRTSKRLQEELLPISRLALSFASPGLSVEVEAFEDDGPIDGHISIKGYRPQDDGVEVTYARDYEDTLRSELIYKQGFAPGVGAISRDKSTREITAEMAATDLAEVTDTLAASLMDLHRKKTEKNYPAGTILLIAFDVVAIYGHTAWCGLFDAIKAKGGITVRPFRTIYFVNCANNELQTFP